MFVKNSLLRKLSQPFLSAQTIDYLFEERFNRANPNITPFFQGTIKTSSNIDFGLALGDNYVVTLLKYIFWYVMRMRNVYIISGRESYNFAILQKWVNETSSCDRVFTLAGTNDITGVQKIDDSAVFIIGMSENIMDQCNIITEFGTTTWIGHFDD